MDLLTRCRQAFTAITRILKDNHISDDDRVRVAHDLAEAMQYEIQEFQRRIQHVSNDNDSPQA